MPVFKCPDCGSQISTSAVQCPSCGRPPAGRPPAVPTHASPPVVVVQPPAPARGGGFIRGIQIRLILLILGLGGGFVASWLFGPVHELPFGDYCKLVTSSDMWTGYSPVTESNTPSGGAGPVSVNRADPRTSLIIWGVGGSVGSVVVGSLLIGVLRSDRR